MALKGVAAVAVIAGLLVTTPAVAVGHGTENREPVRQERLNQEEKRPELDNREKAPEDIKEHKKEKKDGRRKRGYCEFVKDPLGTLEKRKNEVQQLLKEGKIPKEKAESILKRIDEKMAEIKAFNGLSLEEKREKLIRDCREYLDGQVKKGLLEPEKAERIYKEYAEKIKKWDGTGYPRFFRKFTGEKTE